MQANNKLKTTYTMTERQSIIKQEILSDYYDEFVYPKESMDYYKNALFDILCFRYDPAYHNFEQDETRYMCVEDILSCAIEDFYEYKRSIIASPRDFTNIKLDDNQTVLLMKFINELYNSFKDNITVELSKSIVSAIDTVLNFKYDPDYMKDDKSFEIDLLLPSIQVKHKITTIFAKYCSEVNESSEPNTKKPRNT